MGTRRLLAVFYQVDVTFIEDLENAATAIQTPGLGDSAGPSSGGGAICLSWKGNVCGRALG